MKTKFAFDLDGTVTTQELLPIIASELGLMGEMKILTDLTLKGIIGFEDSFRLRCAILRSIPVSVVQEIVAEAPLEPHILQFIQSRPEDCCIVTGNLDVWIKPILDRIGCQAFTSTAVTEGDQLIRLKSVMHKSEAIHQLKRTEQYVVAIGESINDMPMFEVADLSIAFGGVHSPVQALIEMSDYVVYKGEVLCRLLNTL